MSKAGKKLKAVAKERKKEKDLGLNDEAKRELHRTCANVKTALDELFAAVEAVPKAFGDKHQRKTIAGAAFTLSELLGIVQWWYPPPKAPDAVLGQPRPTADNPEKIEARGGDPVFPDGSSAKIVQCQGGCGKLSAPGLLRCYRCATETADRLTHKEKPSDRCAVEGCKALASVSGAPHVIHGPGNYCYDHYILTPEQSSQCPKPNNAKDSAASEFDAKGDSTPDAGWTGIPKTV